MLMVAFWDGCIFCLSASCFPFFLGYGHVFWERASEFTKIKSNFCYAGSGDWVRPLGDSACSPSQVSKRGFSDSLSTFIVLGQHHRWTGLCLRSFTSTHVSLLPLVHIARASKLTNNITVTARGKPLRCVHVCSVSQTVAHIVQEELNRSLVILSQNNKCVCS